MKTPKDFRFGERVQLHPATDLWMRGARFGTVQKIGHKLVHVMLDHPQVRRVVKLPPDLVLHEGE